MNIDVVQSSLIFGGSAILNPIIYHNTFAFEKYFKDIFEAKNLTRALILAASDLAAQLINPETYLSVENVGTETFNAAVTGALYSVANYYADFEYVGVGAKDYMKNFIYGGLIDYMGQIYTPNRVTSMLKANSQGSLNISSSGGSSLTSQKKT
jgi:hypothetical protein